MAIEVKETARLMRADLKKRFPRAKISVTSSLAGGKAAIYVKWIGGPGKAEVEKVAGRYQSGSYELDTLIVQRLDPGEIEPEAGPLHEAPTEPIPLPHWIGKRKAKPREITDRDARAILESPPADWRFMVEQYAPNEQETITKELDALIEQAARLRAYIEVRAALSTHEKGVKHSNVTAKKVRKILGYYIHPEYSF